MPEFPEINWMLNRIHEWGQPEQHPLNRIGLTRLAGVGCVAIETLAVAYNAVQSLRIQTCCLIKGSMILFNKVVPGSRQLTTVDSLVSGLHDLKTCMIRIAKIIAGIASTIFFGLLFSPEINFRLHLKLGLAVDNWSVKKEKQIKDQQEFEIESATIKKERADRFAQFQKEIYAIKNAEKPKSDKYPSDLADLLIPKK